MISGVAAAIERERFVAAIEPEVFKYISVANDAIYRYVKPLSHVVPVTS
jgi:hypothetical protein